MESPKIKVENREVSRSKSGGKKLRGEEPGPREPQRPGQGRVWPGLCSMVMEKNIPVDLESKRTK